MDWIIINMKRAVDSKRDFLMKQKASAVVENEPKLILVKMINRFGTKFERALSSKGRFNRVLEDILSDQSTHYLMDVNVAVNHGAYFTADNKLNAEGRIKYWKELIEQLKLFDFRKLSLKPLKKMVEEGRKLPTPPRQLPHNQRLQKHDSHRSQNSGKTHTWHRSNWHY